MQPEHYFAAAVFILAGLIQGASGFGFGLASMGLLPFVMETKAATIIVALLVPVQSLQILRKLWSHASLRKALPYLAGIFVGQPIGVWIFVHSGAAVLKLLIGATLIVFCSFLLLVRREIRIRSDWRISLAVGLAGGIIGGACNTGGPPMVLYIYMQGMTKEETSATLQVLFFAGSTYKVAILLASGQVLAEHASWALVYLLFAALGIALGMALFRRIDAERLRRCVYAMLLAVGASLVLTAAPEVLGRSPAGAPEASPSASPEAEERR